MNLLVKDIGGILGYSPGGGSIANGGAVVMNLNTFGTGAGCPVSGIQPGAPFNLGRTNTHEIGHFFTLDHPWGPAAPSCAADDGFADTPNTGQETYFCPANGSEISCGNTVLTMNFMDYVNDACMYMFTPQQMAAADAYISAVIAPAIKPGVCTPATPTFNLLADNDEVLSCPDTDTEAVFTFTYSTVQDFDETTTFSASGQPAGTTVSFTPPSRSTDGPVTMTINNLMGSAQGDYTITVTGTSATENKSVDVTLKNNCTSIECDTYASAQNLNLTITDGSGGNPGMPLLTNVITVPDIGPIESLTLNVDVSHTYVSDLNCSYHTSRQHHFCGCMEWKLYRQR